MMAGTCGRSGSAEGDPQAVELALQTPDEIVFGVKLQLKFVYQRVSLTQLFNL